MRQDKRIEKLESTCKRLTLALAGMVLLGVAVLCMAAKPHAGKDRLQTRTLEVVDGDGNVRIRLGPADEGYGLVVYDVDGQFQATLTDAPLAAAIQLRKDGRSLSLMAMEDGSGITIRDGNGRPRALMLQQEKGAELILKDADGKTVFAAPQ